MSLQRRSPTSPPPRGKPPQIQLPEGSPLGPRRSSSRNGTFIDTPREGPKWTSSPMKRRCSVESRSPSETPSRTPLSDPLDPSSALSLDHGPGSCLKGKSTRLTSARLGVRLAPYMDQYRRQIVTFLRIVELRELRRGPGDFAVTYENIATIVAMWLRIDTAFPRESSVVCLQSEIEVIDYYSEEAKRKGSFVLTEVRHTNLDNALKSRNCKSPPLHAGSLSPSSPCSPCTPRSPVSPQKAPHKSGSDTTPYGSRATRRRQRQEGCACCVVM